MADTPVYTVFCFDIAGSTKDGISFDVRTRSGAYAGVISHRYKTGLSRVWFNSTATRGTSRRFAGIQCAADYLYARRRTKGFTV